MDGVLVLLAGMGAGFINTVVGSGSLISFPTLVALGAPPLTANVTNNMGLLFGSLSGTWGYRAELAHQGPRLLRLLPVALLGAVTGATLLLWLPASAFEAIVPVLVGLAVLLVLVQPWIASRVDLEHEGRFAPAAVGVFAASIYGGYFGAAQGVLLLGLLGVLLSGTLQELNAVKNALAAGVNLLAAVVFLTTAPEHIDWASAAWLAVGAIVGGQLGARVGRRLPPRVMRGVVAVVGVVAIVVLLRD